MKQEITAADDGCILELSHPAKNGTVRVWIDDKEMKESFGLWLQMGPQSILFDSAIAQGTKLVVEYETVEA